MTTWRDEDVFLTPEEFLVASRVRRTEIHKPSASFCATSFEEALRLAEIGWEDGRQEAQALADEALELAEGPFTTTFEANWQVSGAEVDIARFLSGIPENMVEYEPIAVSNAGRVVRLVVSCAISASVSQENVIKRGGGVIALTMALEELQHATEVWVDFSVEDRLNKSKKGRVRILVKGAHDSIDAAHLAFWLGHPSVLRQLMFGVEDGWKGGSYFNYGHPLNPDEDMEQGTIYLPCLLSYKDVPDPERFIREHLEGLGLLIREEK